MKIRRDKRDILFSILVRERANWTCQVCGKFFPEGVRRGLECSHHFSRRKRSVRWDPSNASAHCMSCHQKLGENPVEFRDWISEELYRRYRLSGGHLKMNSPLDDLSRRANQVVHLKKHHLEELYANLKASHAHMLAQRAAGESGWLEFEDPIPEGVRYGGAAVSRAR